jgi:Spy/CpxP family protein refolding chaperone
VKKFLLTTGVLVFALSVASFAFSGEAGKSRHGRGYDHGCDGGHMMGSGCGSGMHGGGRGMYGGGHMMGRGCEKGHRPRGWKSMEPEQREKWKKMRSKYQMETLELRKQLVTKKMELETLWDQPDVDQKKVETLSDEVAELQAELEKKHNKFLLQCRKNFGNKGWSCPGSW